MDSISKTDEKTLISKDEKTPVSKEEEDHISKLPDYILADIISKHGTLFAAGTAVISSRWKHLFALIPEIYLDDTFIKQYCGDGKCFGPSKIQSHSFAKFTSRILDEILKQVKFISNLTLILRGRYYEDQQIIDWIHTALECKVQILDIDIFPYREAAAELLKLMSDCKSLYHLTFGVFYVKVPTSFSLPCVSSLVLHGTIFEEDEVFCSLISGLPSLQNLTLTSISFFGMKTIKIVSSLLKYLSIEECWSTFYPYGEEGTCFILDAPALEEFYYSDCLAERNVIKNLESIRVASLDTFLFDDPEAFIPTSNFNIDMDELVRACSGAKTLFFSSGTLPALQVSNKPVPVFRNLTDLQLYDFDKDCGKLLRTILRNSPKLDVSKKLAIEKDFVKSFGSDALPKEI